jgi:hypothetical protein
MLVALDGQTVLAMVPALTVGSTGHMMGLYMSTDGGLTWSEAFPHVTQRNPWQGFPHQVVDRPAGTLLVGTSGPTSGSAFEDGAVIARSSDGGKNWKSAIRQTEDYPDLVTWSIKDFASGLGTRSRVVLAAGLVTTLSASDYHLLKSENFGFFFDLHKTLTAGSGTLVRLNAIVHLVGPHLLAGGLKTGGNNTPTIWKSSDTGETWTEVTLPGSYGAADAEITTIISLGGASALAGGRAPLAENTAHFPPRLYRTLDWGNTWTELTDNVVDITYTGTDLDHSIDSLTVFGAGQDRIVMAGLRGDPTQGFDNFRLSGNLGLSFGRLGYFATPYNG